MTARFASLILWFSTATTLVSSAAMLLVVLLARAQPNTIIAYSANRGLNPEIYGLDVYGGRQWRMTQNFTNDSIPVWSPDGTRITFVSFQRRLYSVDLGTGRLEWLGDFADAASPVWR